MKAGGQGGREGKRWSEIEKKTEKRILKMGASSGV